MVAPSPASHDIQTGTVQPVLSQIDDILTALSVVVLLTVLIWWLIRDRRDPLRDAPPRPNELQEDAVALAILVYFSASLFFLGMAQLLLGESHGTLARLIVASGSQLAGIAACLGLGASRFEGGLRAYCLGPRRVRPIGQAWVTALMMLLAIGLCPLVGEATIHLILHFAPHYEFKPHPTISALHDSSQPFGVVIALVFGAAVIAPIAEECFFRGLLQSYLYRSFRSRWLALVIASLAFGAVHYSQPHSVPALALLAMLIGYTYERTGSLIPAIAIHAAFNLKSLLWDALSRGGL